MALYEKINSVIDRMDSVARENSMIALNASISSNKMRSATQEAQVFRVLSSEMRKLSDATLIEIKQLEEILKDVKTLSKIINISGSLRMLNQRFMKLVVLHEVTKDDLFLQEAYGVIDVFSNRLSDLSKSEFNTVKINVLANSIEKDWKVFTSSISSNPLDELVKMNEDLLVKIQEFVMEYEAIGG